MFLLGLQIRHLGLLRWFGLGLTPLNPKPSEFQGFGEFGVWGRVIGRV